MASEHTGRTVFEYVEPDPDAVLEAYGIDSPAELLPADPADSRAASNAPGTGWTFVGDPDTVVSRQDRSIDRATATLEALQRGRRPTAQPGECREKGVGSVQGFELVGPDPTTTRIGDDRFGSSNAG